jgi:hypothetical protein
VADELLGDEHGGVGLAFGLMSILLASVIGVVIFAVTISPTSNAKSGTSASGLPFAGSVPSVPGLPSSVSEGGLSGVPSVSQAAACEADAKSVAVALEAYNAVNGAYATPPAPWSAATYVGDYAPLTSNAKGDSFMRVAPDTTHYVVEYDSAGNVWVEPPGQYDAAFNPAHSLDVATSCTSVAR